MSDKTEAPTPRRIAKAREQGDVAVSAGLSQAVAFCVAVVLVPSAVRLLGMQTAQSVRAALSPNRPVFDPGSVAMEVVGLCAPLLITVATTSAVLTLVQTGGLFAPGRIAPDLARVNPIAGLGSLCSWQRLWMAVRSALCAAAVGWLVVHGLRDHLSDFARVGARAHVALGLAGEVAIELARRAAALGLLLALLDLLVTRRVFFAKLKMSKAEVQKEHRESEGDPQLKAARRRAHHEVLTMATVHAVRQATVVIVNPQHLATALRYVEGEDEAPVVVAGGEGEVALRIQDAARRYGIPIVRDVPVARALSELQVGDAIPEVLYETIAEILREIWQDQTEESRASP